MSKKIIIACSGGPDSMALLHKLNKENYQCIVAHVNYQSRDTAIRDQKIVESFCQKHGLACEIKLAEKILVGNFQAQARKLRYDFFEVLAKKYKTKNVYVAHHQDDLIETYIMQKKRNITPNFYGLKKESVYKSISIIRPLLSWSKKDILSYCQENDIDYGVDESNLLDGYKRNKIRHSIVDKLNGKEKKDIVEEIKEKNIKLAKEQRETKALYKKFKERYQANFIIELSKIKAINVLREWFHKNDIYNISDAEFKNILKFIKSFSSREFKINEEYSLFNEYGKLKLSSNLDYKYNYKFDEIVHKQFNFFEISDSGSRFEAVTVDESDFPITIRNFKKGDKINMQYGQKKVSRFFIDNKIPQSQRRSWPIVINKDKEVILVPKIGCNITHFSNKPNMFVVK